MTARVGMYSAIAVALAMVPATVLVAAGHPWGFFFYGLAVVVLILAPLALGRWLPAVLVRRWTREHGVAFDETQQKVLLHLAAHSGLPYTNPEVVREALNRRDFYVSWANRDRILYLQDPVFDDAELRRRMERDSVSIPIEKMREAVAAGATPKAIRIRWQKHVATLDEVVESFVSGLPEEYFSALLEEGNE